MKKFVKIILAFAVPMLLGIGISFIVRAASYEYVFADCRVSKPVDYQTSLHQKYASISYGTYEITYISHTGDTYRAWFENSSGKNISNKSSFSDKISNAKIKYNTSYIQSELYVRLNISTAPTNFYSVTVSGSWTPNNE